MDFSACLDCLCPCLKSYSGSSSSHQYEQVATTSKDIAFSETIPANKSTSPIPQYIPQNAPKANPEVKQKEQRDIANVHKPPQTTNTIYYDQNLAPFTGCEVLQKFNNNTGYNKRFVWLNSTSRTIHMSQHMTKERRHKEASLSDVTSVVAGPPAKKKAETEENFSDLCLTVNFKRGGGIDLQFKTKEDRDVWFNTLLHIVSEFDL